MKKTVALILTLLMILGVAASASAQSWWAPVETTAELPFQIEVIPLRPHTDALGVTYYTAFDGGGSIKAKVTVYYAIKLTLPSYKEATAYYANSSFSNLYPGAPVRVSVSYTNVAGKTDVERYKVKLADKAQTLWYNGKGFDATWVEALNNSCGCGSKHILKADAAQNGPVQIKAAFGAWGELSDIYIEGCYRVEKKSYRGVKPCPNCKATNLNGFLFSGDCAAYKVFFSTDSKGKVTGAYVTGVCGLDGSLEQNGAFTPLDATLYGWAPSGIEKSCNDAGCQLAFKLQEIPAGAKVDSWFYNWNLKWGGGYEQFIGKDAADKNTQPEYFKSWIAAFAPSVNGRPVEEADFDRLYVMIDGEYKPANGRVKLPYDYPDMPDDARIAPFDASKPFTTGTYDIYWSDASVEDAKIEVRAFDKQGERFATMYPYWEDDGFGTWVPSDQYTYGHIYYFQAGDAGDGPLFKMLSATSVDCDTNDASYLNTLDHVMPMLGFGYEDIAAGRIYMTEDILLDNFGFITIDGSTAIWGS
ncbi:MAG: hypothetical protein Q4E65_01825 [Clostridia bacterium]|nr:hypothetical protein [Clostridia bacterium]